MFCERREQKKSKFDKNRNSLFSKFGLLSQNLGHKTPLTLIRVGSPVSSTRRLSNKGEKVTEGVVQRVAATTHSYSIQMTISASGEILSPLFVCITEASGDFTQSIQLFDAPNIYQVASKSPMFTKLLLQKWFSDVFFPNFLTIALSYKTRGAHIKMTKHVKK